jgi:hypothetical protein
MEISNDRAYFLLDYYCSHSVRLHIGGKIAGEKAASEAKIVSVDRELRTIAVELSDRASARTWRRVIPLRNASVSLHLLGEAGFEQWADGPWHSIMVLAYDDGTTLFIAEPMSAPRG